MSGTTGARRITKAASTAAVAPEERRDTGDPVVGPMFTSVCASVLLGAVLMALLLAMRSGRPVPAYAIFGSALFGMVFSAFLVGALHLGLTDSRRHKDDDH